MLTSREINLSGWLLGGGKQGREERKQHRREEAATLAIGSDAGGRMCGRVEAERLPAIDVLAGGEDEVATLGIFVEPQLPMTHPRGGE